ATGEVLHDLDGHENIVVSVALSPSGRFLASGSYDSSWRLWDAVTGEELLVGHSGGVTSLAFSSCGKWLASGGGSGSLLVWDAGAG
ncbi:quinon protein alcohol dehydrogenase-like superfamily, partial [Baffinella frigidus]